MNPIRHNNFDQFTLQQFYNYVCGMVDIFDLKEVKSDDFDKLNFNQREIVRQVNKALSINTNEIDFQVEILQVAFNFGLEPYIYKK